MSIGNPNGGQQVGLVLTCRLSPIDAIDANSWLLIAICLWTELLGDRDPVLDPEDITMSIAIGRCTQSGQDCVVAFSWEGQISRSHGRTTRTSCRSPQHL